MTNIIKYKFYNISTTIILLNLFFFTIIFYFYLYNLKNIILNIAKTSAILTVINFFLSLISIIEIFNLQNRKQLHILFVRLFLFFSILHTLSHFKLINNINIVLENIYITGLVSLFLFFIIFLFSLKCFRKKYFNIFYYTHFLTIFLCSILIFHSIYFYLIFLILLLYFIYKYIIKKQKIIQNKIIYHNNKFIIIYLYLKIKKINFFHGDYLYLNCYNISKFEYHPFTIMDIIQNEDEELNNKYVKLVLGISKNGDWKNKIYNKFINGERYDLFNNGMSLHILGPFSGSLNKIFKKPNITFIVENIGITSFMSFLNFVKIKKNQKIKRDIKLIWCIDNKDMINFFLQSILEFDKLYIKSIKITVLLYSRNEDTFNILLHSKDFTINYNKNNYDVTYDDIYENIYENNNNNNNLSFFIFNGSFIIKEYLKSVSSKINDNIFFCGTVTTLEKIKLFIFKYKNIKLFY